MKFLNKIRKIMPKGELSEIFIKDEELHVKANDQTIVVYLPKNFVMEHKNNILIIKSSNQKQS